MREVPYLNAKVDAFDTDLAFSNLASMNRFGYTSMGMSPLAGMYGYPGMAASLYGGGYGRFAGAGLNASMMMNPALYAGMGGLMGACVAGLVPGSMGYGMASGIPYGAIGTGYTGIGSPLMMGGLPYLPHMAPACI